MTISGVVVFWSYSHEDNVADSDGIVELAESLRREFALVTGESLTLFVDQTAVGWGDEWRRRINNALAETTFFIPIITPRYFARDECRRELLEFTAQARSLGISELVLPIRYAEVKNLTEQNPDEAIALTARMQYVDWTKLRLKGTSSPEYRTAVNALAVRLAHLASTIAEKQLSDELKSIDPAEEDAEPGLAEIFDQINRILPLWVETMEVYQVATAQHDATWAIYGPRIQKAEKSGPASALFPLLQRLAAEDLPIAERALSQARTYAAKTIELDPLILAAARIGAEHPSEKSIFADLQAAIRLNQENRLKSDVRVNLGFETSLVWAQKRAHISKTMRRLAQTLALYERTISEANRIIQKWVEELKWL